MAPVHDPDAPTDDVPAGPAPPGLRGRVGTPVLALVAAAAIALLAAGTVRAITEDRDTTVELPPAGATP